MNIEMWYSSSPFQCWTEASEPHETASLFRCSDISFYEMAAAQTFIVQHSSRIGSAGYPRSSCQYQNPVTVEHIVLKYRNNSLENITAMLQMLPYGITFKKFNEDVS